MRTPILIAAALALSATAVHAAPRSLSAPQSNPVQTAPEARASETPTFKVQSTDEVKPNQQPEAAPQPAPAPAPTAPAATQAAPAAAPTDSGAAPSAETTPADTRVAPTAKPVRHAQRKQRRQPMTVEQRVGRELRSIERSMGTIGAASAISAISAISYAVPLVVYW
jgi:hypothetical protein